MLHHRTVESVEVMVRKQVLSFQTAVPGTGEMVEWIRARVALPEDLGSTPNAHMVAHRSL